MPPHPDQPWWQRHFLELVVVAVGLVLVVGLWVRNTGDDGGPSGAAVPPAQTTATDPGAEGTTPLVEDGEVAIEGDARAASDLRDAVLKASDLPKGWTATSSSNGPSPLCAKDPISSASPTAIVRSSFLKGGGEVIAGTVASYEDAGTAAGVVDVMVDATRSCATSGLTFDVDDLDGVGDEAVKITSVATIGNARVRNLALVARSGDDLAVIIATGDPVDDALALRALKAELGRL